MPELDRVPSDTDFDSITGLQSICQGRLAVNLVSYDPGLPPRISSPEPSAQCDCACFAVEAGFLPRLRAPVTFYLELTPECNNRCGNCGNVFSTESLQGHSDNLPSLTAGHWAQILGKLQPLAHSLRLTGGEPTLHPEFESITAQAASMELPFTVFTNALWRAPQRLCAHLKNLSTFQGLLISLHGPTAVSHEAFTDNPGSFAETLANIRTAAEAGIEVSLSCVITHYNWNLLEGMLEIAEESRVTSLVFNRLLDPQDGPLMPKREELRSAVQTIHALRASGKAVKLGNCLPSCFVPTEQGGCLAGLAFFTVDPWGRVRPCNHARTICGDLLQQSVEDVWQSPELERWRNSYPEQCKDCLAFASCRGGCRAQGLGLYPVADPLMTTPLNSPQAHKIAHLTLYEQARPVGCFARRPESFGTLLLKDNRLYPVSRDMLGTLDSLDGKTTLRQIKAIHGKAGLNLVTSLYYQGMIELQSQ